MLIIENNILVEINKWLNANQYTKIFVLVDENTRQKCFPLLALAHQFELIEIKSGEVNKTLSSCTFIWKSLLALQADRNALLINLGGGVLCDMGGFCAATYKRGIDFVNIPTTLLAQVDASIGAKTGIDFENQKNMIGLFSKPKATFIDATFLNSLPKRELLSGFAEVLKHGLIADQKYFQNSVDAFLKNTIHWNKIIDKSIAIKANIVAQDPNEKGIRKILNFGHTIGHALESYALKNHKSPLLHGEAVVLGMIGELFLSKKRNFISKEALTQTVARLKAVYRFKNLESFAVDEILLLMENDKKNQNGAIQCVVLKAIGKADFDYSFTRLEFSDALLFIHQNTINA